MIADPDLIPSHIRESLDRYVHHGIPTGDCLRAVLAGDLYEAFARADPVTAASMASIVAHIVHRLPSGCWGSEPIVDEWILTYRRKREIESSR